MTNAQGKRTPYSSCSSRLDDAFTLIEVLVVVAIIALLAAILLPSLKAARQQANGVVCAANLRQLMIGAALYSTDHRNYIAGPNTSGVGLHRGGIYAGAPDSPVQDWDFISPVIGRQMGFLRGRTEPARLRKFLDILMTKLHCPDNRFRYTRLFQGTALPTSAYGGGQPLVTSYMTPAFLHLMPAGSNTGQWETDTGGEAISLPTRYAPKVDRVGTAGQKVYAFEGARYLDTTYGPTALDYSTVTNTTGLAGTPQGNFTSRGPGFTGASGEPYLRDEKNRPTQLYRDISLRHRDRMSVAFFDGHGEALHDLNASRPHYFTPHGSVVRNPAGIAFNGLNSQAPWKAGMVLP